MTPTHQEILAKAKEAKAKLAIEPEVPKPVKRVLPDTTFSMSVAVSKTGEITTDHFHVEMPHKNQTEQSNCPMCRYLEGEFRALSRKLFSMAARSGLIEG